MKRTKIILIMILAIMEVCSIFLTWKSLSHKITIIDNVKFKEENKKEKKAVAIMLNDGNGSYKESESTTFPKVGYIYNTQKSGCIDTTGKEVVNAISYESGKVSLRLNQKLYCYLYFDKKEKPIIDKFYINDETSNKVTKEPEVTIHLKWSDQYIKEYCISETQDIDSCSWQSTNGGTEITSKYTFTSEGKKTIYAYIKDIAEGVSEVKSDSIEYKVPITGGDLANKPIDGVLESTGVSQDELKMRYYGTNPANYICFGTIVKDTCVNDTDKYMYRIIGVDKSNRFKLIKKEALNTAYQWHNSTKDTIQWSQSALYTLVNGSAFLSNISSKWSDKIETVNWKYGSYNGTDVRAITALKTEQGFTSTISAKIGILYMTDLTYAYQKEGADCGIYGNSYCIDNWLFLKNNDSTLTDWTEWTMTASSTGVARAIHITGFISSNWVDLPYNVRPVFYLKSNIEVSGNGTITDPYIIVN